jgi:hypothetical protein
MLGLDLIISQIDSTKHLLNLDTPKMFPAKINSEHAGRCLQLD